MPHDHVRRRWSAYRWMRTLIRFAGSTRLAVTLLVTLILVLAVATAIEAAKGREYVDWYVYRQPWFSLLFVLLCGNVLVSALRRFPWGKEDLAFLLTHLGLVVLLGGGWVSRQFGVEGQVRLEQGIVVDHFTHSRLSEIRVVPAPGSTRPATVFAFTPGPLDWPAEKRLALGTIDGTALAVDGFRRQADPQISSPDQALPADDEPADATIYLEARVENKATRESLDRDGSTRTLETARGPIIASFGYNRQHLGFSLQLLRLVRNPNPGGEGLASIVSVVRLLDASSGTDRVAEIAVNSPLTRGGLTVYQQDFRVSAAGNDISILQVTRHPGRPLVYAGAVCVCLGTLLGIFRRKPDRGSRPLTRNGER
jgi:hypothetical protein